VHHHGLLPGQRIAALWEMHCLGTMEERERERGRESDRERQRERWGQDTPGSSVNSKCDVGDVGSI
jgi:hypothetical protein